jgi:hypothetical protein
MKQGQPLKGVLQMTKAEMTRQIRNWNIKQTDQYDKATEKLNELHKKYLKLNGTRSCDELFFIIEINNCEKVSAAEKLDDIRTVLDYFEACGQNRAMLDLIQRFAD